MQFAYPLSWWLVAPLAALVAAAVWAEYRRTLSPLTSRQRALLVGLRALALVALALFLFRPIAWLPPVSSRDAVVPILVDVSRSMRLTDEGGQSRMTRASDILDKELLPALSRTFTTAVYDVGETIAPASGSSGQRRADSPRSDLSGALDTIRQRYRGQRVAGIVVLSDGGDTGRPAPERSAGPPVFTVGIGSPEGPRDREVLGVTAGDPRLDQASVDLHVSARASGFGRAPFQIRVLEGERVVETERVAPGADGSPLDETFTVSPDPVNPSVYTVEIPADPAEAVVENNRRSVLVSPAGRKRRVLVIEGAPGFDHSFLTRALIRDPGLEIDSVVRKGKNSEAQDTFFVQAPAARAPGLLGGFPLKREDLYAYDALVLANIEGDSFTRAQLGLAAEFVSERGGGLLVLGSRSFAAHGLAGTPLEEALPVALDDRRGGLARAAVGISDGAPQNKIVVTPEGEKHPIMRVGASIDENRKRWAALPALSATASLGGPRAGATVLAVTETAGGALNPVVAVQRFGQGRSMVFAGEASWRWKMMMPSSDRTHEFFWRQSVRWLAGASPDPVSVTVSDAEPGETATIAFDVRDASFAPVAGAVVDASLVQPGGASQPLKLRPAGVSGRYTAAVVVERPGLYHVKGDARQGANTLGTADRWFYVGGADREFADPRLNEGWLRRTARESGGRYVRAADAGRVVPWLQEVVPQRSAPERRDLWHEPWAFVLLIALLSAEWVLRRVWGLR